MKKRILGYSLLLSSFTMILGIGVAFLILSAQSGIRPSALILPVLPQLILVGIALLLLVATVTSRLAKSVVRPVVELDLVNPDPADGYDELSPLLHKIRRQNDLIAEQMADLRRSQEEFRAITANMAEGLIILDAEERVLTCNDSAKQLIGEESDGKLPAGLSEPVRQTLQKAIDGTHGEVTFSHEGKIYQFYANPVHVEGIPVGAVIMILDITEKTNGERIRREFTSNVSHELKTPLTSIYGISEMLCNGLVKSEDVAGFAKNIHDESGRLITLVNDIIKLSQLDEGTFSAEKEPVDLYAVAREVCDRLAGVAAENHVLLSLDGDSMFVDGITTVLSEMIYNLTDNAIKYNKEGGHVRVNLTWKDDRPTLTVRDTGIGIPKEQLPRVFERFYRVDKSHSKAIGGTGLGLSIVKHGAAFHDADLNIESKPGVGTVVTIRFRKSERKAATRTIPSDDVATVGKSTT